MENKSDILENYVNIRCNYIIQKQQKIDAIASAKLKGEIQNE